MSNLCLPLTFPIVQMFNLIVMERYLFIKESDNFWSVRISERLYEEIMQCVQFSECHLTSLFQQGEGKVEIQELAKMDEMRIWKSQKQMKSIFVKDRDYFRRIDFSGIRWIEAAGSYCCLYLENAPKLMLSFNLRELAVHLPNGIFMRVHRSYIVNIDYIDSFIGNMLFIGKKNIPVSKQYRQDVMARLNVLGNTK